MNNNGIVITVGRQMGSGGRELGRRLAKRLGIDYYDKELLTQAANEAGLCPEFFRDSDEKRPSLARGLYACFPGINPLGSYDAEAYSRGEALYKAQCDYIRRVAERSSCVIVGRTADYILRDYPRVCSIFVSAKTEDCIARVRERQPELSEEQARTFVEKTNKARASFYDYYADKQWGVASSYDLSVSTSAMSIDDLVEVIVAYLQRRFDIR